MTGIAGNLADSAELAMHLRRRLTMQFDSTPKKPWSQSSNSTVITSNSSRVQRIAVSHASERSRIFQKNAARFIALAVPVDCRVWNLRITADPAAAHEPPR